MIRRLFHVLYAIAGAWAVIAVLLSWPEKSTYEVDLAGAQKIVSVTVLGQAERKAIAAAAKQADGTSATLWAWLDIGWLTPIFFFIFTPLLLVFTVHYIVGLRR